MHIRFRFLLFVFLLINHRIYAQIERYFPDDSLNIIDSHGMKQGIWVENGSSVGVGSYLNDQRNGMWYFYDSDNGDFEKMVRYTATDSKSTNAHTMRTRRIRMSDIGDYHGSKTNSIFFLIYELSSGTENSQHLDSVLVTVMIRNGDNYKKDSSFYWLKDIPFSYELNKDYKFEFSKPGLISCSLLLDTHVPDGAITGTDIYSFVDLSSKVINGMEAEILGLPFKLITYNIKEGKFKINRAYTSYIQYKIRRLPDQEKIRLSRELENKVNTEVGRLEQLNSEKEKHISEIEKEKKIKETEALNSKLLTEQKERELALISKEKELQYFKIKEQQAAILQQQLETSSKAKEIELLNQSHMVQSLKLTAKEMELKQQSIESDKREQSLTSEKKIQEAELEKQKTVRNSFIAGFTLVLGMSMFVFRSYREKQRSNILLEKQKVEIEVQKDLLEEKNKEVVDSITYAKRIQKALLASEKLLNENLNDHFVLYQPKDIVSGDFYWAQKKNDRFFIATSDCTGHGVPGAFMSLLNISFLNEAVGSSNLILPSDILAYVRNHIIGALKEDVADGGGKDGMDCVLCSFNFNTMKLEMACANNPVWILRAGNIVEIKPDKFPVGKHDKDGQPFTLHEFQLNKNDIVYTLTDGYADQFGGPKGKKFKYKQLQELIIANAQLPMAEQKQALDLAISKWKGSLEQVDDILLIGIKI